MSPQTTRSAADSVRNDDHLNPCETPERAQILPLKISPRTAESDRLTAAFGRNMELHLAENEEESGR